MRDVIAIKTSLLLRVREVSRRNEIPRLLFEDKTQ